MPDINAKTPRTEATIQGFVFSIPRPFAEGHVLSNKEASALNQTYLENVRNNRAKFITKAVDEAKENGTAVDLKQLQADIDEYVKEYDFGDRIGGKIHDPAMTLAVQNAEVLFKNAIRAAGKKLSDYTRQDIRERATKIVADNPQLLEEAKKQVAKNAKLLGSVSVAV